MGHIGAICGEMIIYAINGEIVAIIFRRLLRLVDRLPRESVPLRLMSRTPIDAQMNIHFTKNNIYVIFQNMLLFGSILVSCFCIVFGLTLRGPSAAEKSERKQQRRYQRLTPLLTTLNTFGL